jgi:flagellar basal body rod protein FlgG
MMVGQVNRLESTAENLANSSVPGYKRLQVSHKSFETLFNDVKNRTLASLEDGKSYDPVAVDFTQGAIRPTERPLDFALTGKGFFVVTRDNKEFYTRKGDFRLDPDGMLKTADGMSVQGAGGALSLPASTNLSLLTVDHAGALMEGNTPLGALRIVSFADEHRLQRAGTTLYTAPQGMAPEEADPDTRIVNRSLEASNTTIFEELADTITCVRNFEACQRMLRAQDENEGRMISQLG